MNEGGKVGESQAPPTVLLMMTYPPPLSLLPVGLRRLRWQLWRRRLAAHLRPAQQWWQDRPSFVQRPRTDAQTPRVPPRDASALCIHD
jgi:hypothetical protein